MLEQHGARALEKLLAPAERADCAASNDPARFLAKRFAAKEALGKALGTGIRAPVLLPAIAVSHDELGKPGFQLTDPLAAWVAERGLTLHLSIADEREHAIAYVIAERP
jgi:holo-[acyl-carrier protein] synthase